MAMKLLVFGLLSVAALTLTGCGGATTYSVSGTVTYNGEPLPEGYIAFVPEGPGRGGGGPITNGNYQIRAQAGKNRVEITASKMMPLPRGQVGMGGAKEEVQQYLPARYNFKTELKADLTSSTSLNFDLKPE